METPLLDPFLEKNILNVPEILTLLKNENFIPAIKNDFNTFSTKANYEVEGIFDKIGGFFKKIFVTDTTINLSKAQLQPFKEDPSRIDLADPENVGTATAFNHNEITRVTHSCILISG
jgi:hypothetical protein